MRTDWRRSLAVLLGTGVIALTAACGAEVSGAALGGAGTGSAQQATTSESSEVTSSTVEQEPAPSTEVADPTTSPDPSSPGEDSSAPAPTTSPTASSSGSSSAKEYAFLQDYCLLMPTSYVTGLEKDTARDKTTTCTYQTEESSDDLRIVKVTGGFALSYEELDESYNVDLEKVKIDGRDGFTWTNSTASLRSALFNLPGSDGRQMSILVIITDDQMSPAAVKEQTLALAADVSKEVPR